MWLPPVGDFALVFGRTSVYGCSSIPRNELLVARPAERMSSMCSHSVAALVAVSEREHKPHVLPPYNLVTNSTLEVVIVSGTTEVDRLPELLDAKALQAELGVSRSVAESVMRQLPIVQFESVRKVYVRRPDIAALVERPTFQKTEVVS